MKIIITDKIIDYIAGEYEKTPDYDLLKAMAEDKRLQGNLLEVAKGCGLETFQQYYERYLRQFDRLN